MAARSPLKPRRWFSRPAAHWPTPSLFYADVKGRMEALGRDPDHLKILPGALVVVGETAGGGATKARFAG